MLAPATSEPARLRNKKQAAEHLNLSERGVERLVADGDLKAVRLRGRVLFTQAALDECVRRNEH